MIILTEQDKTQISDHGICEENVSKQIRLIREGGSYVKLNRSCTVGDGVCVVSKEDFKKLETLFFNAVNEGRVMKFVPSSGAASRMFKSLDVVCQYDDLDFIKLKQKAKLGDVDSKNIVELVEGIKNFAFYNDLQKYMSEKEIAEVYTSKNGNLKKLLFCIFSEEGMNYGNLPKGILKFHCYGGYTRTAFEEHLSESKVYTLSRNKQARIHFSKL